MSAEQSTRDQSNSSASQCARCGNCCRWSGFVHIQPEEVETITRFMGLSPSAFTARYTRLLPSRAGLSLTETGDGACVFLDGNACRIHAVKPRQCRDFPAVWTREEFESPCQMRLNLACTYRPQSGADFQINVGVLLAEPVFAPSGQGRSKQRPYNTISC